MTCKAPVLLANDILKLSDGTTTIDFHSTSITVLSNYIHLPPPQTDNIYISSQFANGNRLASSRYGNRTIEINFLLKGRDQDDLRSTIRSIHRLLNDATYRNLTGHGDQVYLEYQWGLEPNESVYFDVLTGQVSLPENYANKMMWQGNTILDVTLQLVCKPFGRFEEQIMAAETIDNSQSAYDVAISQTANNTNKLIDHVNDREGQTFTPAANMTITHIGFMGFRPTEPDLPGTVTVEVWATLAGVPAGAVLISGETDANQIGFQTVAVLGYWMVVKLGTPLALVAGTMYAFSLKFSTAAATERIQIRSHSAAPYAGGTRIWSNDGGATWNIDATDDLAFLVYIGETQENWQDITTDETHGDVPARLWQQLSQTNAVGTEKIWMAKRTGDRYDDDIWFDNIGLFLNIVGGAHFLGNYKTYAANESDDIADRIHIIPVGGNIAADTELCYARMILFPLGDTSYGSYRVLIRCKVSCEAVADYDHISIGLGYASGGISKVPSHDAGEYFTLAADNIWEILDLGLLNVPTFPDLEHINPANTTPRIYLYAEDVLTLNEHYRVDIAYVFLLPIDEGVIIADSVLNTRVLVADGLPDRGTVNIVSGGNNYQLAEIMGVPFTLGRERTRIYVLRDDTKNMTFSSIVRYIPQFLVV